MRQIRTLLPSTTAALVAVAAVGAQAQAQRRVTGTVTGEGGTPLAGATVQVVGTQTGTYTNESGRFSIQAGAGTQTIRVRRIGYRAQLVTVSPAQTDIGSVSLTRDVLQLEAQVVTGTATSVSRANAANAVTTVNADQLVGRAPAQTIDNALQGKVPGAIISVNSGAPGGGTQVQMRGVGSINASTAPLYVVDGVLVNNQSVGNGLNSLTQAGGGISNSQDQQVNRIADLAPEEIESIEVLKGPAAGAIYGSKGSNGVIVIRTKRGSSGAPAYSTRLGLGNYALQTNRELNLRCFGTTAEVDAAFGSGTSKAFGLTNGSIPCHDFQKEYYSSDGPSYNTTFDVRGGTTGGTTYYVNGSANRDNAIQKGTFYQKQSIVGNLGQTLGKRVTLQFNNNFVHTLTDRGIFGNDNSPIVSPVDVFSATPTFFNLGQKVNGVYPINPFISSGTNPFQTSEVVKLPQDVYRYIGNVNATWNVLAIGNQTFDLTALGGIDVTAQQNKIYSPPTAYFEPADGFPGTAVNSNYNAQFANFNLSGVHRYTASAFTATTSAGVRREYRNSDLVLNQGKNIAANTFNFTAAGVQSQSEARSQIRDLAYYAQEEFLTLQERLLLTAALNSERSSVNGDPKKFYAFPKFSGSYRLPFTLVPATDEIKLRIAYGKAGNQPLYGYSFTGLPVGLYSGTLGAGISSLYGTSAINPEISTEVEGGIDWTFFKGRLSLEGTLFRDNISNLILQYAPAPSTGFTTQYVNSGKMYKTGTELGISAIPVQLRRFNWNTRFTFSTVNSRVTSLGGLPCFTVGYFGFGDPYVCDGSGKTSTKGTGYSVTTIRVPNGGATPSGYTYLESLPRFIAGFSNDFTFGLVRLSGLLDWRYGGYAQNLTQNSFDGSGTAGDTAAANARNTAAANGDLRPYNQRITFVKLRELNVSVGLPSQFTQRYLGSRAKDVRLEFAGRNLYTWSSYGGYDPEVSNFSNVNLGRGQDVTPYPPSRNFFFSVVANF